MRRFTLLLAVMLTVAACGGADSADTADPSESPLPTTTELTAFPVTVTDALGEVTIEAMPEAIVSLSTTGTEMLFAIGAGDQVVAVDEFSTYPEEAPITDLSGYTPNLEAILAFEPDLVVISFDPGDLQAGLDAVGVPSLLLMTASSLEDSYFQLEILGAATGHLEEAQTVSAGMAADLDRIVADAPDAEGVSFFHEVDDALYSSTSASFLGQIYALFGLTNIADGVDDPGGFGFPQLSSEYVISEDPDLVFLGDADFGVTPESLLDRPGWDGIAAVKEEAVIPVDTYLASNWGPRVVELAELISDALSEYGTQ